LSISLAIYLFVSDAGAAALGDLETLHGIQQSLLALLRFHHILKWRLMSAKSFIARKFADYIVLILLWEDSELKCILLLR